MLVDEPAELFDALLIASHVKIAQPQQIGGLTVFVALQFEKLLEALCCTAELARFQMFATFLQQGIQVFGGVRWSFQLLKRQLL